METYLVACQLLLLLLLLSAGTIYRHHRVDAWTGVVWRMPPTMPTPCHNTNRMNIINGRKRMFQNKIIETSVSSSLSQPYPKLQCCGYFYYHHNTIIKTRLYMSDGQPQVLLLLPEGYQDYGNFLIRKAAQQCGVENDEDLSIEWKPGQIVVTVQADQVYLSNDEKQEEEVQYDESEEEKEQVDEEEEESIELELNDETDYDPLVVKLDEDDADVPPQPVNSGIDVTQLARAINTAMDDDEIGLRIAETHEIEVTTPGASDVLQGEIMFTAYKGFEVIVEFQDLKTKKHKTMEGRLVERNQDFTIINIKGRTKKIQNDVVVSVKLPKAKKEKGAA